MHILIADENRHSQENLVAFLGREAPGAVIQAASDPDDPVCQDPQPPPDILITEVDFAGNRGGGFTLRDRLRRSRPGMRTAFLTSGAIDDLPANAGFHDEDALFSYPPLDGARLLEWIRDGAAPPPDADTAAADSPRDPTPAGSSRSPGDASPPEPGTRLGDYELVSKRRVRDDIIVYKAIQRSVQRTVALELLRPSAARDEAALRRFRAMVRAKAGVVHPHIASVYEAHEDQGVVFFTREMIDGKSLAQLANAGVRLKQETILNIARVTAEALGYLADHDIPTIPLEPRHVCLDRDNQPRLANTASAEYAPSDQESKDVRCLGAALARLLDPQSLAHAESVRLVSRMGGLAPARPQAIHRWSEVLAEASALQQKLSDARSFRPPGEPYSAAAARRPGRGAGRAFFVSGAVALALIGAFLLLLHFLSTAPSDVDRFDSMKRIPAGGFVYQDGEQRRLEPFWIDEFEVTIGQYAGFLEALKDGAADRFDHPDQPAAKGTHVPEGWDDYFAAARRRGAFRGQPISLSCPVFGVDWWDAHAYARWKGRRLPTEEEWEKAARGREGSQFPWGDEFRAANANTGEDYSASGAGGSVDGYNFWAPVDAHPADRSSYDVAGLGGNVSEWTASLAQHPQIPDREIPVVRGASFLTPAGEARLVSRLSVDSPNDRRLNIGFRTASDSAPTAPGNP